MGMMQTRGAMGLAGPMCPTEPILFISLALSIASVSLSFSLPR